MKYDKLTIDELINSAGQSGNNKDEYREIYIKRLNRTITVKKPNNTLILDATEVLSESKLESDYHLVYNSVISPNLKDTELHDVYNVSKPTEILDKIFTLGEIIYIGRILLDMAGYNESAVKVIEDIKN